MEARIDVITLAVADLDQAGEGRRDPTRSAETGEFSIGHAVSSKAEVDAVLTQAPVAGATLTGQAHDRSWGIYSRYFRDPDGHLLEALWKPPIRQHT